MDRFSEVLNGKELKGYITPLFWQHGENGQILREEIRQMNENGIGGFIVESRPHPDFLGDKWWNDLDIIIDEAKKRGMKVWIFDDSAYPSGFGNGHIRDNNPEYLKVYLAEAHIDAIGSAKGASFLVKYWLEQGDEIVRVIAGKRLDKLDEIDQDTLIDLTDKAANGVMYWDIPAGDWRIFIFKRTRRGGEEWTKDYINPLEPKAVRAFIDAIYEEHYNKYSHEFGDTIEGFFTDEPRFGNASTYEATLGKYNMVIPYSGTLLDELGNEWEGDFSRFLPCLWYDCGKVTPDARYTYMNVVSRLYGENYTKQIGDWCRERNVKLIGHVVEDNGAHARLGYGSGHFFRAIKGQDYSGLDVVYQVWPEYTSGRFTTPFGYLDAEFFYWGITKMASSAGHIDPGKNGTTVCEVFGAYGWQEGLKLMKWLTDHICVRGVNFIIPHAFSPKLRDPDCPPHFYARGLNPQWKYFFKWSQYANRLCHLLSGGVHIAPVAVIYHAEAEWGGRYEPFEKAVKALLQKQIDCDVIPIDTLVNMEAVTICDRKLVINNEEYQAVIVPYSEYLPEAFIDALLKLANSSINVIFMSGYPENVYYAGAGTDRSKAVGNIKFEFEENSFISVSSYDELAEKIKSLGINDIEFTPQMDCLRYYHYDNNGRSLYLLTNESKYLRIDTTVRLEGTLCAVLYDAMENRLYDAKCRYENGSTLAVIRLEPYESIFLVVCKDEEYQDYCDQNKLFKQVSKENAKQVQEIAGEWKVSICEAQEYPVFRRAELIKGPGNISVPGLLPEFSGTIRYVISFNMEKSDMEKVILLDLGEAYETIQVFINGKEAGVRICPPYTMEITGLTVEGDNLLQVDVTNTLAKKYGDNAFDRAMPQEPSGLLGPVRLLLF